MQRLQTAFNVAVNKRRLGCSPPCQRLGAGIANLRRRADFHLCSQYLFAMLLTAPLGIFFFNKLSAGAPARLLRRTLPAGAATRREVALSPPISSVLLLVLVLAARRKDARNVELAAHLADQLCAPRGRARGQLPPRREAVAPSRVSRRD